MTYESLLLLAVSLGNAAYSKFRISVQECVAQTCPIREARASQTRKLMSETIVMSAAGTDRQALRTLT
jgi:hypothetical protein